MPTVVNRRAALGVLAALPAGGLPVIAAPLGTDTLSGLIMAHRSAWETFRCASDALEAAGPGYHARFAGIGRREYLLGLGQEDIAKRIAAHFEEDAEVLRRVDRLSP